MANNELVITAGLNIPETVNNIQNELNKTNTISITGGLLCCTVLL